MTRHRTDLQQLFFRPFTAVQEEITRKHDSFKKSPIISLYMHSNHILKTMEDWLIAFRILPQYLCVSNPMDTSKTVEWSCLNCALNWCRFGAVCIACQRLKTQHLLLYLIQVPRKRVCSTQIWIAEYPLFCQ